MVAQKKDKFDLYQESVQNPEFEVKFMRRIFRELRNREARTLREDFCGTSLICCEWVRRVRDGMATGLDLDKKTLDYARKKNVASLGKDAERVNLVRGDVLRAAKDGSDIVCAYNFSYFIFKDREVLGKYFRRVYETLGKDGLFFLDVYGGPDAQVVQEESTDHGEFSYVWDQARFNPITNEILCHIHFDFPRRPRMRRAFSYDWRLWSAPELKDLLAEAGFKKTTVYWEGTDNSDGSGNGVFRRSLKGDNSLAWVAYLAAEK